MVLQRLFDVATAYCNVGVKWHSYYFVDMDLHYGLHSTIAVPIFTQQCYINVLRQNGCLHPDGFLPPADEQMYF